MGSHRSYSAKIWIFVTLAALVLIGPVAFAQTNSSSISGTVLDQSGAIVPQAKVTLQNQSSGDTRTTVSNGEGYFAFNAVPPGSYSIKIEMQGFHAWEAKDIAINAAEQRKLAGIKLQPGAATETVVVQGAEAQITPEDSGEKSFTIDQKEMQNVPIVGQNAAEFIKILPGMAFTGGVLNQSSYAAQDEGTGHGPVGSFSANGQRTAALDITSDGAHIIDPGCNCGQAMNTNIDMTSELKVQTSNFGADSAKGPIAISTVGKSGGKDFHGDVYMYSRYYSLNANDWLNKNAGINSETGRENVPRPQTKYFYPGANIGGPLIIPGLGFNKSRNRVFFFVGAEYYKQDVDNGIYRAVVPTADMRNGDFTNSSYYSNLNGYAVTGVPLGGGPNGTGFSCTQWDYSDPKHPKCVASRIDPATLASLDPGGNGLKLMNTYPLPNVDPVANKGDNYVNGQTRYSNMLQLRARFDVNISDSTKLFVSYNRQRDSAEESLDTLWTGNAQSWVSPTVPYPSPLGESTKSDVATASLTKVFNSSLTNEVIFNYTYLNLPNYFKDPSKVDRDGLGLNYSLLFPHPNPGKLIFPQMTGWSDGIANQLNTGFEINGTVYAKKSLPSVADNIFKVWGTHTAKFGFYWERTFNQQPGNGAVNGSMQFANWGGNSTGNAYADMLIGNVASYSEQNFDTVPAFRYISTEFYGQDSWKVSRRVTLEYGLRVSHLGPWSDITGYGFAAWYPDKYVDVSSDQVATQLPGLLWHKRDSSVPLSGTKTRLFYYNPRVGFAWDLYGTGNTVLRGGYGVYRFHDEQNVQNGAYSITQGSFSANPGTIRIADLAPIGNAAPPPPGGVQALDPTDDLQPTTQSYSFTVAQRAPWQSQLEISYVGNRSSDLSNWNNNFYQLDDLLVGSLFNAYGWDPTQSGCGQKGNGGCYSAGNQNALRPYKDYASLKIINHKMYSNYNAMQVTWNKQTGPVTFMTNYTWGKALGIRGEGGAATGDPTSLKNNYGTLPNNRKNIFNVAYVWELPKVSGANPLVRGAANGWQLSGVAQFQSGTDLQAAVSSNFNYSSWIPPHTIFMGVDSGDTPIPASNTTILGTGDITLMPKVICNPAAGLQKHQYINGKCFSGFSTPGQQGTYIFPTLTGPGYFNTDISAFKNFTWGASESKKLQFRFSGYNFLNHPVPTFIQNDPALNLQFDQNGVLKQPAPGTDFGTAYYKIGHRIIQGAVKFSF
jgi:hypothetical protein